MTKCPQCGHDHEHAATKCTQCGAYFSKIIELLDQEQELEYENSLRGHFDRIFQAENRKAALVKELKLVYAGLSKTAVLTLAVVFFFVFALLVSVL